MEEAIAHLEGGTATILTSSGLAAISTAVLAFAESGDHILIPDNVYQPGRTFADKMLKSLGVETTYYDPLIGAGIEKLFRPNTRLVMVEAPGSQTFEMQDIPAIAAAAHAKNIWVLADNTWATPLYCKPLSLGADVSIEAATKYIVGHADAMMGAVTANARAAKYHRRSQGTLGTCPGSEETYLALRGLRRSPSVSSAISDQASRSRNGSRAGRRSTGFCIPLSPVIPATRSGSGISPAPAGFSPPC